MSKPASHPPPPEPVVTGWWIPFADFLEKERRYSPHTLRNYRRAFDDFYRWLGAAGLWAGGFDGLDSRAMRDFVDANQRMGRLHVQMLTGEGSEPQPDPDAFAALIERAINGPELPDFAEIPDRGAR